MKIDTKDILTVDWSGIREVRVANGLDNMQKAGDTIKVIMDGDNSYNTITINKDCIIAINGVEVN